ncbi:YpmS family protein [Peribacillus psychrosaccharolyticus]|uniref:YpmS family protein n=1 Tax=Peribacillus psychrosaccharolyticus TaxID=1407 RepID=UPI0003127A14|nr:YpmS family protein [Peribacillus psychrosaccharolyticus]MEC2056606.1 YpmS family protein [Peribacillus psychrosaccharolyticus]MED3745738.1 YpmS family protein [Peribacillus psychrosaccharolyticus]
MTTRKWKTLFIALAALNIIGIITVFLLISLPVKDEPISEKLVQNDDIEFQVHANREDLNLLIAQYLEKEGFTGIINYEVLLTDEVELFGTVKMFGREVELKLTFEPIAQKNGDLVLVQKTISLGQMGLPVSYVMNFINKQFKTPDWVTIQPNQKQIYVSLQNMKLKSDIKVKAKKFDLENDDISFILSVPSL